jgi:NAD(P)-dependent dehydrogenase (short-subunit alcohol dehydrogenase family)
MTPRDLNGSRTLVLGGSGVLGPLIAQRLLDRGGKVMLADRNPWFKAGIQWWGGRATFL